ncbi:hypothetical protein GF351_02055 [Candidatus Woesearchaeota archaeon]|nr:hypothetical protein [Candidatus Woesearchaeota archaeon]
MPRKRIEESWEDEESWVEDSVSDQSIYSEEEREVLIEDDCISPEEDAFMKGYEEA